MKVELKTEINTEVLVKLNTKEFLQLQSMLSDAIAIRKDWAVRHPKKDDEKRVDYVKRLESETGMSSLLTFNIARDIFQS